jgi:hypothetical protein
MKEIFGSSQQVPGHLEVSIDVSSHFMFCTKHYKHDHMKDSEICGEGSTLATDEKCI